MAYDITISNMPCSDPTRHYMIVGFLTLNAANRTEDKILFPFFSPGIVNS